MFSTKPPKSFNLFARGSRANKFQDFTEKDLWFHDVFHENGTAYNADELMHAWYHTTGSEQRI